MDNDLWRTLSELEPQNEALSKRGSSGKTKSRKLQTVCVEGAVMRQNILIAALVILAAWWLWLWHGNKPKLPQQWQEAPPAKQVAGITKVDHKAPPKVKVLPKKTAGTKLNLPTDVAQDDQQQIIATADIAPAPDGATAVAVMDMTTGDSKILIKAKPRPVISFLRSGAAGVRYGISSQGEQQAAVFVRQDVLRVMELHLSLTAEARTAPASGKSEAFGAIEVSYRW